MSTEPLEQAVRVLHGVDAARRVGWAKAYAAEQSKEELSRELNMMREERDIMRAALSRLFGFSEVFVASASGERYVGKIRSVINDVGAVLDPYLVTTGRALAHDLLTRQPTDRNELHTDAEDRRRRKAIYDKAVKLFGRSVDLRIPQMHPEQFYQSLQHSRTSSPYAGCKRRNFRRR